MLSSSLRRGTLAARAFSSAVNAFGSPLPAVISSVGWEGAWSQGVTPWDVGKPAPIIAKLAASLPEGLILVPGCGSGHDAAQFARQGRRVLGVDLSPTAVALSRRLKESSVDLRSLPASSLDFRTADIFAFPPPAEWAPRGFAGVFDYTLMAALPPALWPRYAQAMRPLVAPDGEFVLLMFPVGKHEGGPPYAMQPDAVCTLMEAAGWDTVSAEPLPPADSHKPRAGREVLARFRHNFSRVPLIHVPHADDAAAARAPFLRKNRAAAAGSKPTKSA